MFRVAGCRWMLLAAAIGGYGCTSYGQVLTFSPLLRSQFGVHDPYQWGWDMELGARDSAATWWAGLHYARMSGEVPRPEGRCEVCDASRRVGIIGGLVSALASDAALEYGIHVDYVQLHRSVVGYPSGWTGTVKGTAIAVGASARLCIQLGEVASVYVGWDVGYRKMQEQRKEPSFVDTPFSDAPYFGVLAGLKLRLQ